MELPPVTPPPISDNLDEVHPGKRPFIGAWGLLALIIIAFTAMQLSTYFMPQREESAGSVEISTFERSLKLEGAMAQLSELSPSAPPAASSQADSIDKLISDLEPVATQRPEAARALVLMQHHQGVEPSAEALAYLSKQEPEFAQAGLLVQGKDPGKLVSDGSTLDLYEEHVAKEIRGEETSLASLSDPGAIVKLVLAMLGGVTVLIGGGAVLLWYGIAKSQGQFPPVGYAIDETIQGADVRGLRMCLYFASFFAAQIVAGIGVAAIGWGVVEAGLTTMALGLIGVALAVFTPIAGFQESFASILGDRTKIGQKIGIGFLAYMANLPLVLVITLASFALLQNLPTPSHGAIEDFTNNGSPMMWFTLFLLAAVYAPITEEIMFRGMMFPGLTRILRNPTTAIVITSVAFAVIHPQGPILWPGLALIGATAAVITRQTGSLIPAIAMHAFHNGSLVFLNYAING